MRKKSAKVREMEEAEEVEKLEHKEWKKKQKTSSAKKAKPAAPVRSPPTSPVKKPVLIAIAPAAAAGLEAKLGAGDATSLLPPPPPSSAAAAASAKKGKQKAAPKEETIKPVSQNFDSSTVHDYDFQLFSLNGKMLSNLYISSLTLLFCFR